MELHLIWHPVLWPEAKCTWARGGEASSEDNEAGTPSICSGSRAGPGQGIGRDCGSGNPAVGPTLLPFLLQTGQEVNSVTRACPGLAPSVLFVYQTEIVARGPSSQFSEQLLRTLRAGQAAPDL